MLRTALRPRYLGLLTLAVVMGVVFVIAGRWQWSVAHDVARADALIVLPPKTHLVPANSDVEVWVLTPTRT